MQRLTLSFGLLLFACLSKFNSVAAEPAKAADQPQAPLTVQNFLSYVDSGWYDGTLVHRAHRPVPLADVLRLRALEVVQSPEDRQPAFRVG